MPKRNTKTRTAKVNWNEQLNNVLPDEKKILPIGGPKRTCLQLNNVVGEILLPGDEFSIDGFQGNLVLGPGLSLTHDERNKGTVTLAGVLVKKKTNTFYIHNTTHSYVPYKMEDVVGVIIKRSGDQYVVDIGTRDRVLLSKLAFEGATKKNKPDLKIGDAVFGRILDQPPDYPFEITCVTSTGKALGLGPLENGLIFQVPIEKLQYLLKSRKNSKEDLIKRLGEILPFESVYGTNGYVWVKSQDEMRTILISQAIQSLPSPNSSSFQLSSFISNFKEAIDTLPPKS